MKVLTRPRGDRVCHRASRARTATSMKTGSPVSCVRAPNSTMKVPTPAVHVTVVSPDGIPLTRLTVPYGIPVDVLNAAASHLNQQCLSPNSTLQRSLESLQATDCTGADKQTNNTQGGHNKGTNDVLPATSADTCQPCNMLTTHTAVQNIGQTTVPVDRLCLHPASINIENNAVHWFKQITAPEVYSLSLCCGLID